ncbi:minor capsid protein [Hespellia stercorisuis]|uniref:Phage putative head morphogenesis protein, SPP1 gp7 family n=1 Tax=Hespellia stercorisuis DSM 15480 TaxID=1121950 RepID=A0A1M6VG00_9FIRM|nr:minor capsid protein [Hespellia stercorisuis]SHK80443.1 phage putative head morphogenesis protein, SPP1 gp7 family [Hespellia stercorisuis DSM 15480]
MGLFDFLFSTKKERTLTKDTIYQKYYSDYTDKPYISDERDISEWLERIELFPKQSLIPKSVMKRYADGLLPGHVYMLYWLNKYTGKKVPSYFEYKYGIDFEHEKPFLISNGFLENDQPTKKGLNAIEKHISVINKHQEGNKKPKRDKESIKKQILEQKKSLVRNGFSFYEYIACKDSCEICKRLDGKVFPISELTPGVNAPPMCDNCRCSISAREDDGDYNAWLDFLSKGGTTEGWNKLRK